MGFRVAPDRPTLFKFRNFARNIKMSAVNEMFPGAQRNSTTRDSKAFMEGNDLSTSTKMNILGDTPMYGLDAAGE